MNDNNNTESVLYAVGTRGYSAYEVAVQNGFIGTEQEWLDSLVGPQGPQGTPFDELTPEQIAEITGPQGKSAYEIAVDEGFDGTEEDFVNSYINAGNYYNKNEINTKTNNIISDLNTEKNTRKLENENLQLQITGLASGSPLVADDVEEMTDTTKVYVNTTDGKWYYYDGEDWLKGGVYQATSDPEVEDVRNGYNDIDYDSAGESVRTQISELHQDLGDYVLKKTINMFTERLRPYTNINSQGVFSRSLTNVNTIATEIPIDVESSTQYSVRISSNYPYEAPSQITIYYYTDNTYISSKSITYPGTKTFTTPASCNKIRVKIYKSDSTIEMTNLTNNFQIAKGNISTFVLPYAVNVGNEVIENDNIKFNTIHPDKMEYMYSSDNIMPYTEFEVNKCFDEYGVYTDSSYSNQEAANETYISVISSVRYSFNCKLPIGLEIDKVELCWYTSSKIFISKTTNYVNVESPANASYLRIGLKLISPSNNISDITNLQLNKSRYLHPYSKDYVMDAVYLDSKTLSNRLRDSEFDIKNQINSKLESIITLNKNKKLLNFGFCTDTHIEGNDGNNTGRVDIQVLNYLGKENWLDFISHGGDIFNAYVTGSDSSTQGTTHKQAVSRIEDALVEFKDVKIPLYITRGNHDVNVKYKPDYPNSTETTTSEKITQNEFYMLAQHNFTKDVDDRYKCSFYKDYDNEKIRVIILDSYVKDTESAGLDHDMLNWLANNALMLGNKNDYGVLIITHTIEGSYGSNTIAPLITAFKNGTSYSNSTLSVSANYTQQGQGKFIAFITGHTHNETDSSSLGFWVITSGTSYNRDYDNILRNIYANVFTVDMENNLIYKYKMGSDNSKVYNFDDLTSSIINE